jgi:hypothetical protein
MKRYPCAVHGCTATVPRRGLCPWHQINGTPDDIKDERHARLKRRRARERKTK